MLSRLAGPSLLALVAVRFPPEAYPLSAPLSPAPRPKRPLQILRVGATSAFFPSRPISSERAFRFLQTPVALAHFSDVPVPMGSDCARRSMASDNARHH